jgi:hypothetical protein
MSGSRPGAQQQLGDAAGLPEPPTSPAASAASSTAQDSGPSASTTPTATLLLEQGVDLAVIKELLGHAHIGVTAGVYAHVRLRLQRQAIDTLGHALGPTDTPDDPPTTTVAR